MTTTSARRPASRPLAAVAEARRAARVFLEALGEPAAGREQADTVVLVVSELTRTPDLVDGTEGFGRHMVNDLALAAVVTPGPAGVKTVRALLPR
ncbi:ATP-binding protein [Streptomyces sp. NPDC055796]